MTRFFEGGTGVLPLDFLERQEAYDTERESIREWSLGEVDSNCNWQEIDHKDHTGLIRIVCRFDGEGRNPRLEKQAQDVVDILNSNKELRMLLCLVYAGAGAYLDDGEAQDSRAFPTIDFMRDSVATIKEKMARRCQSVL